MLSNPFDEICFKSWSQTFNCFYRFCTSFVPSIDDQKLASIGLIHIQSIIYTTENSFKFNRHRRNWEYSIAISANIETLARNWNGHGVQNINWWNWFWNSIMRENCREISNHRQSSLCQSSQWISQRTHSVEIFSQCYTKSWFVTTVVYKSASSSL